MDDIKNNHCHCIMPLYNNDGNFCFLKKKRKKRKKKINKNDAIA